MVLEPCHLARLPRGQEAKMPAEFVETAKILASLVGADGRRGRYFHQRVFGSQALEGERIPDPLAAASQRRTRLEGTVGVSDLDLQDKAVEISVGQLHIHIWRQR